MKKTGIVTHRTRTRGRKRRRRRVGRPYRLSEKHKPYLLVALQRRQTIANIARQMHASRETVAKFIHEDDELTELHHRAMISRVMEKAIQYSHTDATRHPLRTIWLCEAFDPGSRRITGWKKYLKYEGAWKSIPSD